ncbi:MAG TPA: transglutaminase-like domain-containing protein, partial [Burkholderiales bacterium]|nr:transglutaminase-like domain-containing protein [Burkholderiales bacterium]
MMSHAERFRQVVCGPDEAINLGEAALLIAAEEYRDLDIASYLARLDQLAATLKRRLRPDIGSADTIVALNRFLFEEHGFSGDAADYYDPRNSFLNEVLDRKRGIPITLAVVYIEIGRRIGLPVQGISFPAHFLVKCPLREGTVVLDPYAKGISLSFDDLKQRIKNLRKGVEPSRSVVAGALATASNKDILVRMLRNLKGI